jgi:uroporphyrinogen-III synthase
MSKQNKTLLMIRAYDQAALFVSDLAISNPVVFTPIVRIEPLNIEQTLPVADMLIFSSSNAVRFYADIENNRDVETVCVGSMTANVANDFGFKVSQTFETAKLLIAEGADVKASDNSGNTPLDLAESKHSTGIIKLLRGN